MQTTSVASFQKNMSALLAQTIKYNEPLNVCTEDGNVIILSDEDYRGMVETLYLNSIPGMREKLLEGKAEPLSECVPENKVEW
ncbi:MAG: type II toxin-antitoxin system Phd/YefM family antitoxin [Fretibacterium sp.]|nr:type II toxin-antitoxin system Phd/YefM family antitoxin [Fretibacterium sp.]